MPPLGVVPDGVARPHADPLGDGTVLLQLLGQLSLNAECLVGRLKWQSGKGIRHTSKNGFVKNKRTLESLALLKVSK